MSSVLAFSFKLETQAQAEIEERKVPPKMSAVDFRASLFTDWPLLLLPLVPPCSLPLPQIRATALLDSTASGHLLLRHWNPLWQRTFSDFLPPFFLLRVKYRSQHWLTGLDNVFIILLPRGKDRVYLMLLLLPCIIESWIPSCTYYLGDWVAGIVKI